MTEQTENRRSRIQALIARYERPLCSYAYGILKNADTARDAVQETFLRLCRTAPAKIEGHEAAWLFRVCRTRALDLIRKEKPMSTLTPEQEAVIPSPESDPAAETATRDEAAHALHLLNRLPDNQQDRDMIARELLVKFQMSSSHPMVDLMDAYRKF